MSQILARRIRVRKQDSAFVYCVLEAHEGVASYSTLQHASADPHRDIELNVPVDFAGEVEEILKELGDLVYDLDASDRT